MTATPSTTPQNERASGRELALLVLCHVESYPEPEREAAVELLFTHPPEPDEGDGNDLALLLGNKRHRRYAQRLVSLVLTHLVQIDETIARVSSRWKPSRMARIDRNVIRLATAELMAERESPRGVVLAEAVRLATRYGGERSGPFVNGVVESLALELRDAAVGTSDSTSTGDFVDTNAVGTEDITNDDARPDDDVESTDNVRSTNDAVGTDDPASTDDDGTPAR